MVLADLGARVIKVEHPGKGDDTRHWGPPFIGKESAYFLSINRNKESVTLDFKPAEGASARALDREGRRVRRELSGRARSSAPGLAGTRASAISAPGLRVDLRLRPDRAAPRRGRLRRGDAGRGRVDERHRRSGRPGYRLGVAITDMVAGLYCARKASRRRCSRASAPGQASASTSACSTPRRRCSPTRRPTSSRPARIPQRQGNRHATIAPYETFTTRDGEIVIAVGNDDLAALLRRRSACRRSPPTRASRATRIGWRTTMRCARPSIARSDRRPTRSG